ncbi:hypothetical protein A2316_00435 [Candidatus Falkowbacteria bacterium RIFOXYB2_FULL_38_15]|uniref:Cation-transporting P-type ATPase N-terminal domain-containing protein n=1 Tax=Candidatus Falkowbacteria bacterium RIFOXYA2_FULL_38_12 TaxID=1797993 RepID=A0A1F5S1K1_9BACT|nr:MAG: hypothetical protein A2257_04390 [Candidatus Falkowbacteria bacterium RIFOXYA2_FULL_38_12]OGF32864.1 MAG: hypothetical protein A2316_00435 [Candidatus Falkowbacteria bacterium RIFOXYB2_FULL_38_15]OGF44000.1 MAG: hypothetical protein A2555_01165 [Candidatus Falkowbacteria bacterium RIFOXYD2_FULL_39_16]
MIYEGLKEKEVEKIRKKYGENLLPTKKGFSGFSIFLSQFKSPLVYILVIVGVVSFFLKEEIDALIVGAVILLNVLMGFAQEYKSQKTLDVLKRVLKPKTIVIRDGERREIETRELVPGDLIILQTGDKIPADGKLIEGVNLFVNEAMITGESEGIKKNIKGDINLLMGTIVLSGRGIMEIKKTGENTEMGKIGLSLVEIKKEKTPLQAKLEKFIGSMARLMVAISAVVVLVGVFYEENLWEMFRFGVVLAIASIPEGLPIAVTVILALGMSRIYKKNGLIKKMLSLEALGSTSVICTDKTGTLTEGIMRVVKTDFVDTEKAIMAMILTNDRKDSLEVALWDYVKKEKKVDTRAIFNLAKRIYEEPFDSEKKYALTINKIKGKKISFAIGAPEIILSFCSIPAKDKKIILAKIEKYAGEGLKVLGLSCKEEGKLKETENYTWLGLVGIEDPLREGVKETIKDTLAAGIKIKIVTGDHRKTAENVARNLGFLIKKENILEGSDLEKISDKELKRIIDKIILFARVSPHEKLKIIKVLQEKGEIVAMTGDGVNDAPALKRADVGVVLGNSSDVAKEAGDLILLDNNFKTIVSACEEGRLIFSNIKKLFGYVLSNSFGYIIVILGALIFSLPFPLTVVQILWINLICDGPPDFMLGFEPKEKNLMKEKPRKIGQESILSNSMKLLILFISLTAGGFSLFFFWHFYKNSGDIVLARTIVFSTVATASLVYIFSFKSLKESIFKTNIFQNKYLLLGVLYGFILIFLAVYLPGLNRILGTTPLSPVHWSLVFGVAVLTTFLAEAVKYFNNKNYFGKT